MPSALKLDRVQVPVKLLQPAVQPAAKKADAQSPGEAPNGKVSVFELKKAQGVSEAAKQRAIEDVKALAYAYSKGALDIVGESKPVEGPERKFVTTEKAGVVPDLISGDDIWIERHMKDAAKSAASEGSRAPEVRFEWVPTYTEGYPFYKEHAELHYFVSAEQRDLQNVINSVFTAASTYK